GSVGLQVLPQYESPANHIEPVFNGIGIAVYAADVYISPQPADKVGLFDRPVFGTVAAAEFLQGVAGGAGEYKYAAAQRMGEAVFRKLPVLHGGQKILQPAQGTALKGRVEFIPENQGHFTVQVQVPDLIKGDL